jgi:biotin transport system substrate-specific component
MMKQMTTKDYCQIAAFTAVICIVSQLSIPMPAGVPITLQTFIIPMAAVVMGTFKGTISTVLYVLLGAVGLPVYAGMTGGFDKMVGMTGGFIISFPILAFFAGLGYYLAVKMCGSRSKKIRFYIILVTGLLVGNVINYIIGTLWFSYTTGNSMMYSFMVCVAPFLVTSVIKIAMIAALGPVLRRMMVRSGVLEVPV